MRSRDIKVLDYYYEPSQWLGREDLPYGVVPSRLVVSVSEAWPDAVTISVRGPLDPADDPEGISLVLRPEDARLLSAALLVAARRAEADPAGDAPTNNDGGFDVR